MECFEQKKYYSDDGLVEYDNEREYLRNQLANQAGFLDTYYWDTISDEKELRRILKRLNSLVESLK
jgi:hypothetical protein|tara:strand:- start:298 stop:495 length:198 start_codon:yes stop_codon:yes gene_type:complete